MEITLNPGDKVSNQRICAVFRCGNMGGMRRSRINNALILISDPFKGLYKDRWDGDILYYTGMGKRRDQSLDYRQNKTLFRSKRDHIDVYLFEVEKKTCYTYRGIVELCAEPFQERQIDEDGKERNVWIFPLKVTGGNSFLTPEDMDYRKSAEERIAKKLSTEKLLEKVEKFTGRRELGNSRRRVASVEYERNPYIVELAKRRAQGKCDLCGEEAPFKDKHNENYLEVHHISWLSRGGKDVLDNVAALCPNCHKKMHILDKQKDKEKLRDKIALYKSISYSQR